MSRALSRPSLALLLALVAAPTAIASGPSNAVIKAAIRDAERSKDLWATVNMCNLPSSHPKGNKLVGVRVQMPALGFTSQLYFSVEMQYWSETNKAFVASGIRFGPSLISSARHAPHQGGVVFPFKPPVVGQKFTVRGLVAFEWRLGKRVLGRTIRKTGHGYKHVDFSKPPGYNAGTCTITP